MPRRPADSNRCSRCENPLGDKPYCVRCLLEEAMRLEDESAAITRTDPDPEGLDPRDSGIRDFGDYRIIKELGHGAMGVVCLAYKLSLKKFVALKFIKAGRDASKRQIDLFLREAELTSKLKH